MECFFSSSLSLSLELVSLAHHTLQSDTHTKIRWGEGGTPGGSNAFFFFSFFEPKRGRKHTARSEAAKYFTGLPW